MISKRGTPDYETHTPKPAGPETRMIEISQSQAYFLQQRFESRLRTQGVEIGVHRHEGHERRSLLIALFQERERLLAIAHPGIHDGNMSGGEIAPLGPVQQLLQCVTRLALVSRYGV